MSGFKYDELVQKALIAVVKEVLNEVADNGLSGNHHFYIRFRTDHARVKIPGFLRERHPEEVMIVIQYQFWNLKVCDDGFSIELSFNGIRENIEVPFCAMTAFVDPSVKFALQFTPSFSDIPSPRKTDGKPTRDEAAEGNIISFDSFRKR
ncbi:MAG: ClpXP protease specificity-enhancing factor SspB [Holosporaceae bacterium]|jgi:hypothetical protein|nr:ClpXP protease specificity-enhancing factor SspB [Holosporaceae bacterium]